MMNLRRYFYVAMIVVLATCLSGQAFSQIYRSQNMHVTAVFAQVAQGRQDDNFEWRTTFTFSNPNSARPVSGTLYFRDAEGESMPLNFGSGPVTEIPITIPVLGSITLTGVADGSALKVGSAFTVFETPVHGVATYGLVSQSQALSEVSVPASQPTKQYFSAATPTLGIALVNAEDSSSSITIGVAGNDGSRQTVEVTVPSWGHKSLFLNEAFPNLASTFAGSVIIDAGGKKEFVALTLRTADKEIYSSLPSGATALPVPHNYQIVDVFARIIDAARSLEVPDPDSITLNISPDRIVNAFGNYEGIQITLALAELIADSPSELAWVIGHEIGHVYQYRTNFRRLFDPANLERDADAWGFWLSLQADYDPYAIAGALAKVAMATGTAGLTTQWENKYSSEEAHGSFNDRLNNIYESIKEWCALPVLSADCAEYKEIHHPHFPSNGL